MSDDTAVAEAVAPKKKSHHKAKAPTVDVAALQKQIDDLKAIALAHTPAGMTPELFLLAMERQAELLRMDKEADREIAADINARAMKKALRPENEISPMISVYNPKGETKYPRLKPTQIYMMAAYPICSPADYDNSSWSEIELLNQVQPGIYSITKTDGVDHQVLVKQKTDGAGRPERLTLFADGVGLAKDDPDQKQNWPPLLQILTQMVLGEGPAQSFTRYQNLLADRDAQIAALKAQLGGSNG